MESATALPRAHTGTAELATAKIIKPPYLLSPTWDMLLIGGASILLFALSWMLVDKSASTNQISWAAFYLAFIINNPHFMASYSLLYWDKRKELLSNKRFLWAAIVAPTLIIGYMAGCVATGDVKMLSYAVNFMFFTVGWHYIKQIYGTMVVSCARKGYYFSKKESWALKLNLYPVWFMSFINGNLYARDIMHYGIGYKTFAMPEWARDVNYGLMAVSLVGLGTVLFRKWVKEGKIPSWPAIASFAAIYIWYLPQMYHPIFWYMIPFFHSLQYMLFVFALKKNQFTAESKEHSKEPSEQRAFFAKNYFSFLFTIGITAAFAFKYVPEFLDSRVQYNEALFGTELFMFLFITFINIHHYFIDNVIWRRDNPALKAYL